MSFPEAADYKVSWKNVIAAKKDIWMFIALRNVCRTPQKEIHLCGPVATK